MPDNSDDNTLEHKPAGFDWGQLALLTPPGDAPEDEPPPPSAHELQAALLARVSMGELSPQDAEREAQRSGWPPFVPGRVEYRGPAEGMALWTLEMLLSWIRHRTWQAVHRHYEPSFQGKSVWAKGLMAYSLITKKSRPYTADTEKDPSYRRGYVIRKLKAVLYPDEYLELDGTEGEFVDLRGEEGKILQSHLMQGRITAAGKTVDERYQVTSVIPKSEWVDGHLAADLEKGCVMIQPVGIKYTNILFYPAGIIAQYPDRERRIRTLPEYDRWIEPLPELDDYRGLIAHSLKKALPHGVPVISPKIERDNMIREILGERLIARWYTNPVPITPDEIYRADMAFQRAIDRILKKTLINYTGSKPKKLSEAERESPASAPSS